MLTQNYMMQMNNKQKDALNYKIVKCKNWEKDKTCKYGAHCTFAHGDTELRNKSDNLMQMQSNMGMGLMFPPMMMDMNAMMQMNPQMQGMPIIPIDPSQMMNMGMAIPNNMMNNNAQDLNKIESMFSEENKKEEKKNIISSQPKKLDFKSRISGFQDLLAGRMSVGGNVFTMPTGGIKTLKANEIVHDNIKQETEDENLKTEEKELKKEDADNIYEMIMYLYLVRMILVQCYI